MNEITTFSQYGKYFQERVMQAFLVDQQFAEKMLEVFDSSYFELKYLSFLSDRFFGHAKKYRVFPTLQLLVTIIRDELQQGTDVIIRDQIVNYLQRIRMNPDPGDLPYVKDKALDFCRKQALKAALEEAVDLMTGERYDQVVNVVKKAVTVGTTPSVGHDFFNDYEARFTKLQRDSVATGLDELDRSEILNGGLGKGELGVICAATGVGKSHMLTFLGANALKAGVNILHYTLELSETAVGVRYDSYLCDIDSNHVIESKNKVMDHYKNSKYGRLFIKQFPMNTATINTLRSHIERLALQGFRPGLIIIDYADVMRSTRQFDSLRHELKLVYEEIRTLAVEDGYAIWTASQSNRDGSNSDIVDLTNMSEAYGKAMVSDVVLTLSRKAHEKATGVGRLFIAKNRAGRDGILYPIHINTARSAIEIIGGASSLGEEKIDDEKRMKQAIREKLAEVKKDPILQGENIETPKPSEDSGVS